MYLCIYVSTSCKLVLIILLHLPLGVFFSLHLYFSSKKWIFTSRNLDFLDLLSSNLMSSFGDVILSWFLRPQSCSNNFHLIKIFQQGGTRPIFWDETEKLELWKFTTRPRPRKSGCWFFDRDETETRLSDFFMSETRPRRDLTQNSGRDWDETESLGVFFYETETRTIF